MTNLQSNNRYEKKLIRTLSSDKFNNIIKNTVKDLSSKKKQALPLNFRTIFKGIKFALTNPVNSYNIIKLAQSSDIYLNPDFQKSLLEKSEIWSFLKNQADYLPKMGQIMADFGFKEFKEYIRSASSIYIKRGI